MLEKAHGLQRGDEHCFIIESEITLLLLFISAAVLLFPYKRVPQSHFTLLQ